MDITINEKCVFTFSKEEPSIGVWMHKDGVYTGPTEFIGWINFSSSEQMAHFVEMCELHLEKS